MLCAVQPRVAAMPEAIPYRYGTGMWLDRDSICFVGAVSLVSQQH